jgi:septal ring-binding cell division protein DamX
MSDEGFHEIQLNGKQLVFLFMAATVVSVVIFLCGVMVGRGVPDRSAVAANESAGSTSDGAPGESAPARPAPEPVGTRGSGQQAHQTEQAPSPAQQTPASTPASPPADQAPPDPAPDHDYFDDLVNGQKDTRVGTATGRAAGAPPKQLEPAPVAKTPVSAAAKPAAAPAAVVERTSSSSGYAVQLAAVRERSEADGIARRLVSKGYQAYVLVPQPGKPPVYRVQVGRFKTRSEADKIAARLRKNEQFKPWVTR